MIKKFIERWKNPNMDYATDGCKIDIFIILIGITVFLLGSKVGLQIVSIGIICLCLSLCYFVTIEEDEDDTEIY